MNRSLRSSRIVGRAGSVITRTAPRNVSLNINAQCAANRGVDLHKYIVIAYGKN